MINKRIKLSVIVPVYNEIKFINQLLKSLSENDFPKEDREILIIDGNSNDGSKEVIEEFCKLNNDFRVIYNPKKYQVYSLNLGIGESRGEYIVRCDAHAFYPQNYFSFLVDCLEKGPEDLGNVGMRHQAIASSKSRQSVVIAFLLSSAFGVGMSHRTRNSSRPLQVDTLLFGAWRKSVFEKVGCFDEQFIRGQDYEHNMRLRKSGFKILLHSDFCFLYFTRDSYNKFIGSMYQYAFAKPFILHKHGKFLNFRSLVPILFYMTLVFSYFLNSFIFKLCLFSYLLWILVAIASFAIKTRSVGSAFLVPFFMVSQHLAHALGTFNGAVSSFVLKKKLQFEHTR